MEQEKIDRVQVIVLCFAIAFLLLISLKAEAQTNHVVDTVKYEYFDLKKRPIKNSFFAEKTMGWRMWMLASDGVRTRKVFVDTIRKK
tara:strand:- start:59 stop:319 length:261 start_codon:yes stop_codon:yes gene_type:complete